MEAIQLRWEIIVVCYIESLVCMISLGLEDVSGTAGVTRKGNGIATVV